MRTIVKFNGTIPFRVKGQQALPVWQQRALQKAIKNGEGADGSLRFVCRIAADANEAFERIETTAGVFFLNPKLRRSSVEIAQARHI